VTKSRLLKRWLCVALFAATPFVLLTAIADDNRVEREDFHVTTSDGVCIFLREITLPESKRAEPFRLTATQVAMGTVKQRVLRTPIGHDEKGHPCGVA
jgi:hypothetical protein